MVSPTHSTPSDLVPGPLPAHRSTVFRLPAAAASVRAARTHVHERMTDWGIAPEVGDDAVLVISELVTNAIAHAFGDHVVCRLCVAGQRLRIEVEDQARGETVPAQRPPDPDREGGRGLALVDALAEDWGVTRSLGGAGQIVWADLSPVSPDFGGASG
ncbi:ATP-binding protein [Streptomyces spectabilis]|uniref:ATP-binding protein n=1 Tax=Streptomyces spectabilis TaxID=68270 RepID=A0A516RIT8_STRST|nr:ATP-binding protein [Streptomyces spectabilis]QDQ15570.1 ATP-binding protein [Streptomyces spectabilis]